MLFHELEKLKLKALLAKYYLQVNNIIEKKFVELGASGRLGEACTYALQNGGKRFRPMIVLIIAEALKKRCDVSYAALSIELFHTASLIVDDLPCMDNEEMRREVLTTHNKFGTDVTILSSYALIGAGYECVLKNKEILTSQLPDIDERTFIAIDVLAKNNGFKGAPNGQLLDLHPPELSKANLDIILYQKTVIFFETAFLFGWLFGGGSLSLKDKVKQAAYHFGMAFQIYDDFKDLDEDKKKDSCINYPMILGEVKAKDELGMHLDQCKELLQALDLFPKTLESMLSFIKQKAMAVTKR